jgi:hypothetical protein
MTDEKKKKKASTLPAEVQEARAVEARLWRALRLPEDGTIPPSLIYGSENFTRTFYRLRDAAREVPRNLVIGTHGRTVGGAAEADVNTKLAEAGVNKYYPGPVPE